MVEIDELAVTHPTHVVAIVLSAVDGPVAVALPAEPGDLQEVMLCGSRFVDIGLGEWLGFYDWLRDASGHVLGVRLRVDEGCNDPAFNWQLSGVEFDKQSRVLLIFFGADRRFVEAMSDDTDFGANHLLYGDEKVAITFNSPQKYPPEIQADR